MQESIKAILRLSQEDRSILANRRQLNKIPDIKKKLRVPIFRLEKQMEELSSQKEELSQQVREREALIEIENDKIKSTDERILAVKNQKEYYALQREIDGAKRIIKQTEEQLLELEEKLDPIVKDLAELQANLDKEERKFQVEAKEILQEEEVLNGQIAAYDELKKELLVDVDPTLIAAYERLAQRNIVPAAVEIGTAHCQGCAMSIPAQNFNEIIRSSMGECPHCRRILFYKEPEKKEEKAKTKSKSKKK